MSNYYCTACKYLTDSQSNMNKHTKTKKHIEKAADKHISKNNIIKKIKVMSCSMCCKQFASQSTRWRHEKICIKKNNLLNNGEIYNTLNNDKSDDIPIKKPKDKYELLIADKDKQIDEYKALVDKLVSSNVNMSHATSKTADVANKSMSVLKYASLHMTDAPVLEELGKEEVYGILNYKGNDKKLNKEQQEDENEIYVKMVIGHYVNKNLVNVLGDTIVQYFRKPGEDFKKTSSIWAVDVARLSFIIMSAISKDGEKEWKDDKTGKSFKSIVIRPMLTTLNEILHNFIEYKEDWLERNKDASVEEMGKIMNLRQKSAELMKDIIYRQLEQPLLKSVAPSFQFNDYLKKK